MTTTTTPDPYAQRLCPCGKLSCAEHGVVPESRATRALREAAGWVEFMREQGLERLEYEHGEAKFVFALGPVPRPVVPEPTPEPDRDQCACGHSLSVEHTPSGCLRGCSVGLCNTTEVA